MKTLFRILLVSTMIVFIVYYTSDSITESEPLKGPNTESNIIVKTNSVEEINHPIARPITGISTWIGKDSSMFIRKFGEPTRFEPSAFGYEWWVYWSSSTPYMRVGVEKGIVTQLYIADENFDIFPFKIYQTLDETYSTTILEQEVTAKIDGNIYTLSMTDRDLSTRLLVKFENLYAQLYFDEFTKTLQAIRFTDSKTLVLHQPYEMTVEDNLITKPPLSATMQQKVNHGNVMILNRLVNIFRQRNNLQPLIFDTTLSNLADQHSKDMKQHQFFSHDSLKYGSLKERLDTANIEYNTAAENIANSYYDGIEAAHGWLNSEEHRSVLLNENFTHVGSGVFFNYYTQIFTEDTQTKK